MARTRHKRRLVIRYTKEAVRRGKGGKFQTRGGRRETVRIPRPPSAHSGLPRFVVLADGTRLLTTSKAGRAAVPLLEFLRDRGLLLPELVEVDIARRVVVDTYEGRDTAPDAWREEPEELEEGPELEYPDIDEEEMSIHAAAVKRRSEAGRKGWATRKAKAAKRSKAARKGWRTRRRKR